MEKNMLHREVNKQLIKKLNFGYDAEKFVSDAKANGYDNFDLRNFALQKIMRIYNKHEQLHKFFSEVISLTDSENHWDWWFRYESEISLANSGKKGAKISFSVNSKPALS